MVPGLAENFRVLIYDRRGHSRSERPATQGSFDEDGDDLAALLEALELAPAHVVANSGGGNIALRLATRRADVFRSLSCHEPALWGLLEEDPESQEMLQQGARSLEAVGRRIAEGDHDGAARQFVEEIAFGPPARGRREPAGVPAGARSARRADPPGRSRDDRGRSTRTSDDDARALRRGHDARSAAASGCSSRVGLPVFHAAWRSTSRARVSLRYALPTGVVPNISVRRRTS